MNVRGPGIQNRIKLKTNENEKGNNKHEEKRSL
jgi:hypothetical protein